LDHALSRKNRKPGKEKRLEKLEPSGKEGKNDAPEKREKALFDGGG